MARCALAALAAGTASLMALAACGAGGGGPGTDRDGGSDAAAEGLPDAGSDPDPAGEGPAPPDVPPDPGPGEAVWDEGPPGDAGAPPDWPATRLFYVDISGDRLLSTVRLDGTDARTVGVVAESRDSFSHPVLSPDGRRLVYAVNDTLRVMDVDTGQWRPFWNRVPPYRRWSPDSTRLLAGQWGVQVLAADGSLAATLRERDLSAQGAVPVTWSGDGTAVAFGQRWLDGKAALVVAGQDLSGCLQGDRADLGDLWDLHAVPGGYMAVTATGFRLLDPLGREALRRDWPRDLAVSGGTEWERHALNPRPDPSGHRLVIFADAGGGRVDAWSATRDLKTLQRFAIGLDLATCGCPVHVHRTALAAWVQDLEDPRVVTVEGQEWRSFPEDMRDHRVVGWR